jgi:hypothetical protein
MTETYTQEDLQRPWQIRNHLLAMLWDEGNIARQLYYLSEALVEVMQELPGQRSESLKLLAARCAEMLADDRITADAAGKKVGVASE